ncbi:SH3 domain-containing protein [Nitrosomonas sp. Nm51]|uniref:SH3 domain-containing protein n=1 Tax=Nitrosomonas sp. Nm51 TaxID=133720 RepID=UPI0008B771E8|nr:SH3 domain-containing protein [Nitrosomonas sp. Nm51]SER32106.1 SH3 domain-containing protein [Nitrosomonas sp. Nm51]
MSATMSRQLQITSQSQLPFSAFLLSGVLLSGCALLKEPVEPELAYYEEQMPVRVHQQELESMKIKVENLEKQLAEKDAVIKRISAREQDQAQVIQASSKEIARTQVTLHRLATKPSSASLISEAEVAMEYIRKQLTAQPDIELLEEATRLLDAAVANYGQGDYATATYYASQALEFINMVSDKERELPSRPTIRFNTPIILHTTTNANLRREPGRHTLVIGTLNKDTVLTANAYQGNWLMVQTDESMQGWVFNSLVSVVVDD